jgi:hypothetical protein
MGTKGGGGGILNKRHPCHVPLDQGGLLLRLQQKKMYISFCLLNSCILGLKAQLVDFGRNMEPYINRDRKISGIGGVLLCQALELALFRLQ